MSYRFADKMKMKGTTTITLLLIYKMLETKLFVKMR